MKKNENCGYGIVQLSEVHPFVKNEHNSLMLRREKCEFVVQEGPFYTKLAHFYTIE